MLRAMAKNKGAATTRSSNTTASPPTLEELGITKDQSSKLRMVAKLSEEELHALIAEEKAKGNADINMAKAYRAAKRKEPRPEPALLPRAICLSGSRSALASDAAIS